MQTSVIALSAAETAAKSSERVLLEMMITMFILCAIGYIGRKAKIIDSVFSKKLSSLIIKIAQPFLIIASVLKTPYSKDNLTLGLSVIGIGLACHAILAVFAFFYSKPIKDINESKMSAYAIIFANCGFLGLPVIESVLGDKGLFCGAFYQVAFNLFLWSYGIFLLGRGRDDIKLSPKKMILNYGTIPCIIGLLLYVLKPYFELPEAVNSSFNFIGSLCTPISQLIVGGLIATRPLMSLFKDFKLYIFSFAKLLAVPLIAICICKLIGMSAFMIQFIAIMTALPCATNSVMFGEMYDIKPEYAAKLVGMTSIISVLTIPLILMIANKIIAL